uniref:Uncharacterized protein n=1 Tax=Glypta fumiferanae TaxID=389681 RepID=A0A0F6T1D1_9HYME|nr:hypothetical protein [Glypta fumiferanae]
MKNFRRGVFGLYTSLDLSCHGYDEVNTRQRLRHVRKKSLVPVSIYIYRRIVSSRVYTHTHTYIHIKVVPLFETRFTKDSETSGVVAIGTFAPAWGIYNTETILRACCTCRKTKKNV